MKLKKAKYLTTYLIFMAGISSAQKINIGVGLGGMNYKGDLAPRFNILNYRPGISANFRYNLSKAVSVRTGFLFGSVGASDSKSSDPFNNIRNTAFKSNINELNGIFEYNFLNYKDKPRYVNWTPYIFGGLAYYSFKPNYETGSYSTKQIAIPFGVGIKWEVSRPWSLEFEFGTRKLFTDNLDNLGSNAPPVTQKYQQGNPSLNDIYYYSSVTLSYTFYRIVCP